jgi:hypothetical protein
VDGGVGVHEESGCEVSGGSRRDEFRGVGGGVHEGDKWRKLSGETGWKFGSAVGMAGFEDLMLDSGTESLVEVEARLSPVRTVYGWCGLGGWIPMLRGTLNQVVMK